jgi:UDP-3-O-acyl N-acetylglucosamine deacetylase
VFVRSDLDLPLRIPALVQNCIEIPRRTILGIGGATVEMVEHVLAALAGLQIDNCEVWVNGPELPGCDGSAEPFVAAMLAAGIVAQNLPARQLVVKDVLRVGIDDCWVEARPDVRGGLAVRYHLDYGTNNLIGKQTLELQLTPAAFRAELAPARTFLLRHEAEWLRSRGLGSRVTARDVLVFDDAGPIDNKLRFHDECVRHKTLDLIGDLALAGCEVVGQIIAYRSGHRLNAELVRGLLTAGEIRQPRRKTA